MVVVPGLPKTPWTCQLIFPLLAIRPLFLTWPVGAMMFGVPPWPTLGFVLGLIVWLTWIDGVGTFPIFGQSLTLVGLVPALAAIWPANVNFPDVKIWPFILLLNVIVTPVVEISAVAIVCPFNGSPGSLGLLYLTEIWWGIPWIPAAVSVACGKVTWIVSPVWMTCELFPKVIVKYTRCPGFACPTFVEIELTSELVISAAWTFWEFVIGTIKASAEIITIKNRTIWDLLFDILSILSLKIRLIL